MGYPAVAVAGSSCSESSGDLKSFKDDLKIGLSGNGRKRRWTRRGNASHSQGRLGSDYMHSWKLVMHSWMSDASTTAGSGCEGCCEDDEEGTSSCSSLALCQTGTLKHVESSSSTSALLTVSAKASLPVSAKFVISL